MQNVLLVCASMLCTQGLATERVWQAEAAAKTAKLAMENFFSSYASADLHGIRDPAERVRPTDKSRGQQKALVVAHLQLQIYSCTFLINGTLVPSWRAQLSDTRHLKREQVSVPSAFCPLE